MASSFSFEMREKVSASCDGFALRADFELRILVMVILLRVAWSGDEGDVTASS